MKVFLPAFFRSDTAPRWIGILLFKICWLLLVVGQARWQWWVLGLLLPLLILTVAINANSCSRQLVIMRCLLLAVLGCASDQLLTLLGVFNFASGWLPLWLVSLWLAFAFSLEHMSVWLLKLPWWGLALLSSSGGVASYQAGVALGAVKLGLPPLAALASIAGLWLVVLPAWRWLQTLGAQATPNSAKIDFYQHNSPQSNSLKPTSIKPNSLKDNSYIAIIASLLTACALMFVPQPSIAQEPTWHTIGEADFRVYFISIYKARLESTSADFHFPGSTPLQLTLTYQHAIDAQRILSETAKQWQQQHVAYQPEWLSKLAQALPPIAKGDRLRFRVNSDYSSELSYNEQPIAKFTDHEFTLAFAGIWLSERTTAPVFRKKLLGLIKE